MKYEAPEEASWADMKACLFQRDEPGALRALLGAVHSEPDWMRAQDECLRLLEHPSPAVRRLAVTCLGHIARIHRRINRSEVLAALERASADPAVAGVVDDARDDIAQFVE